MPTSHSPAFNSTTLNINAETIHHDEPSLAPGHLRATLEITGHEQSFDFKEIYPEQLEGYAPHFMSINFAIGNLAKAERDLDPSSVSQRTEDFGSGVGTFTAAWHPDLPDQFHIWRVTSQEGQQPDLTESSFVGSGA